MSKSVIKCCLLLGLLGALNSQARATHLIFQKTSLDTAPDSLIDMYFNRPTTYQGNIFGFYVETLARDGQDHLGQVIDFHFTKLGGDGLLQDRRMQFDAIGSGSPTILRFNSGFQGRTWQGLVKVDILSTTDDDFITPDTQQEYDSFTYELNILPVPEPATWATFVVGGLFFARKRKEHLATQQ